MGNISKLTDSSESNGRHICYHDVYVKAHHVEMENVLGSGWVESGDGKCKTVWTSVFHDDNGASFPACVYDWKEYDDYGELPEDYDVLARQGDPGYYSDEDLDKYQSKL